MKSRILFVLAILVPLLVALFFGLGPVCFCACAGWSAVPLQRRSAASCACAQPRQRACEAVARPGERRRASVPRLECKQLRWKMVWINLVPFHHDFYILPAHFRIFRTNSKSVRNTGCQIRKRDGNSLTCIPIVSVFSYFIGMSCFY